MITGRWLGYLTVPHFVFVYFQQSSVGIGLLFVSVGLLVLYAAKGRLAITPLQLATLFVIFLSIVSSCLLFDSSAITRQLVSFICIGLVCVATNELFRDVALRRPEAVRAVISNTFWFLVLIGITGKLRFFSPGVYAGYPKPIFPFAEESHYALTLGVIACIYMMQIQPRLRLGIPIVLLGFAAWFPNATMLCSALMLTAVVFNFRTLLAWTALFGAIFIFVPDKWIDAVDVEYFNRRIKVGEEATNLTTVIYFQGWEQAWIATSESGGLGVGFQRFGAESAGRHAEFVRDVYRTELNRRDGSNLGSKVIGEFGFVGFALLIVAAVVGVGAFFRLRALRGIPADPAEVACLGIAYMFLVELFFRGLGYFNPMFLFYLFCLPRTSIVRSTWRVLIQQLPRSRLHVSESTR